MSKMVKCKHCGQEIAKSAKVCPGCGGKNKNPFYKKWWFWVIIIFFVLPMIAGLSEKDGDNHDGKVKVPITSSSASGKNYEDVVIQFEKAGFGNVTTKEITDLITGWVTKDGEVESVSIDGDTDYNSNDWFEKDAKVVISYHTFAEEESTKKESKKGKESNDKKEESTTTEKVTEKTTEKQTETTIAETTTVVETTAAPSSAYDTLDKTTQNAYRAGIDYLSVLNFSRQGLIDQLSSEYGSGYTLEQAQNAVVAIEADGKVDWRQEAVDSANGYLEFMPFSRSELIEQLTSEYGEKFTQEEAEYAANQVGLQ